MTTQKNSKWKTTPKKFKMEDDQNIQVGRHKKIRMEDNQRRLK